MRWPFRRVTRVRPVERRAIEWPWDVGSPSSLPNGNPSVEDSLSLTPLYAAVRLLSDAVASLPMQQYRDATSGGVKIPLGPLLRQPAAVGTRYDWVFTCMTSLLLTGNAYGLVTRRDGFGFPTMIEWITTDRVWIDERTATGIYYVDGRETSRENLVHIRAFTLAGQLKGVSPIRLFAETIGAGASMSTYGASWFGNGGFPSGTFRNTEQRVAESDARAIRARLTESIRARSPLVYGKDWEYAPIMVPPEEAQFVTSMQLNATQMAAIYGVPPERIGGTTAGGSLTYATVEQNEIAFEQGSVRPWVVRLEAALRQLLPDRQYVRLNLDAPVRSDLMTRYSAYEIARKIGLRNLDEIRALEELAPLPNGQGQEYAPNGGWVPPDSQPAPIQTQRPRAVS